MQLKFTETEEQKIYVTSDWHLNHKQEFVWKSRGHNSIEEHNKSIFKITNEIVRENDILFNLGDFTLNSSVGEFEGFLSQIKCQNVYMLWGNHPNKHYKEIYRPLIKGILGENYTDNSELYPIRYRNIVYIGHYAEVILNKQMFVLSHFPFMIWHHNQQSVCLTGHSHSSCPKTNSKGTYGRILDCSWDEFKRPLSLAEINAIVKNKTYSPIDHHV